MKNYKNLWVNCTYEDQIDRCMNARGKEYKTITEAKEKARKYGGYAIRRYEAKDSGDMLYYKVFK